MPQTRKASHVGTSGPPAGSMPTVHRHRDETIRPASRRCRDDGRFRRSDCPSLKTGKSRLRIGTWNVRTLNQLGKLENLKREAESLNADIIGISETRYIEEGKVRFDSYTVIYSGGSEHQHGVGFIIKSSIEKSIPGYWPVSNRNIMLKLKAKPFDIAIIQTYAPTSSHSDDEIEEHYEEINKMLKEVKSTDVLIIAGDFNAKIGKGSYQDLVGNYGLGDRNPRGDRLLQFCIENNLVVTNTIFQHPNRLLYTWKSPGDVSRNQIDYLLIRRKLTLEQILDLTTTHLLPECQYASREQCQKAKRKKS
ncbi:craniofacial development protein 2-like [Montipora capricornis]|uniref:craniofacial development protein 2-like n=1 Tax=Montipora capricornis TaxID=246305 RepID=UPI0035F20A35